MAGVHRPIADVLNRKKRAGEAQQLPKWVTFRARDQVSFLVQALHFAIRIEQRRSIEIMHGAHGVTRRGKQTGQNRRLSARQFTHFGQMKCPLLVNVIRNGGLRPHDEIGGRLGRGGIHREDMV